MLIEDLLTYIFDGKSHNLTQPMAGWLGSSRRFTAFADMFKDKIRKKIRTTQATETLLDLRLELETAHLLLQEQRLSLVYEPGPPEKGRRPDFEVSYTTSLTFMVEVTRLRAAQKELLSEADTSSITRDAERLADTILSKLGQLLPQQSNVLIIGVESLSLTHNDLRAIMLRIQQRIERSDEQFLRRYQFRDRADCFRHYQRLSEILVRGQDVQTVNATIAWTNPQSKYPLPGKVRTALYRSHAV